MGLERQRPHNMPENTPEIPQGKLQKGRLSSLLRNPFSRSPLSPSEYAQKDNGRITEAKKELNKLTLAPAGVPTESFGSIKNDNTDMPGILKATFRDAIPWLRNRVSSPRKSVETLQTRPMVGTPGDMTLDRPLPKAKTKERTVVKRKGILDRIGRKTRIVLAGVLAFLGVDATGTAAAELTDNQPAGISKDLKMAGVTTSFSETWPAVLVQRARGETPVPPVFDNSQDKGIIGTENMQEFTNQELQQKFPEEVVVSDKALGFLFPFSLPSGKSASYERDLSEFLPTEAVKDQANKDGIKDNMILTLPKDTVIFAPVSSHYGIGYGIAERSQDPTKAYGVGFIFSKVNSEGNPITYVISISTENDPLNPLVDIPRFDNKNYFRGTGWKDLPTVDQFTPLLQVARDSQSIRVSIVAYKGEEIGPQAALIDKTLFLVDPEFLVVTSNNEENKIVATKTAA